MLVYLQYSKAARPEASRFRQRFGNFAERPHVTSEAEQEALVAAFRNEQRAFGAFDLVPLSLDATKLGRKGLRIRR